MSESCNALTLLRFRFRASRLAVSNENQAHSGRRTGLACKTSPATATNQKNSDEMRAATRPRLHALPPPEKAQRSVWFSRWRTAGEIFHIKQQEYAGHDQERTDPFQKPTGVAQNLNRALP